jgi:hypothetical protein
MKHIPILLAAIMLLPVFAKAQSDDPELEYIKKTYSKEKKTIVDEYMALDVQQGAKFWKIYGEYEAKREKLAVQRVNLVDEYVEKADGISATSADKIATAALTNTINLDRLNLETYNKLKAALGAIKAAKFIQLETYLQTAWRVVVQDYIPLISELDKTATKNQ